jgi:hypothetical protein
VAGGPPDLHPSEGVRLLLERREVAADGASAVYRGAIFTPDSQYEVEVAVDAGGGAAIAGGHAAPPELADKLLAHARQTARAASRRKGEGLPPWPHRVMRWRPPGRGA